MYEYSKNKVPGIEKESAIYPQKIAQHLNCLLCKMQEIPQKILQCPMKFHKFVETSE